MSGVMPRRPGGTGRCRSSVRCDSERWTQDGFRSKGHKRPASAPGFPAARYSAEMSEEILAPARGQSALFHGADRNLSIDEPGGSNLVEPGTSTAA